MAQPTPEDVYAAGAAALTQLKDPPSGQSALDRTKLQKVVNTARNLASALGHIFPPPSIVIVAADVYTDR